MAGATEIEAQIRSYFKESWDYLQPVDPQMARFMGGAFASYGATLEFGVWEKEERQHGRAFVKIYQLIDRKKLQPKPNSVQGYQPTDNPWKDVYKHTQEPDHY